MQQNDRTELSGSGRSTVTGVRMGEPTGEITVLVVLRTHEALPSLADLASMKVTDVDIGAYDAHAADLDAVTRFVEEHGLRVEGSDLRTRIVRIVGDPAKLATAFGVDLGEYRLGGRTFLSHTQPVSVPAALDGAVSWVFGLDTSPALAPTSFSGRALRAGAATESSELVRYSVPRLAQLYDFPPGTGAGRCIGIIALSGGYEQSDIDAYFQSLGLASPTVWSWNGNDPSDPISNYQVVQGIEIVGAVVPEATIALYNRNSAQGSVADFYETFSAAVHDDERRPEVLVNPWVFTENPIDLAGLGVGAGWVRVFEELFEIAAMKGITVCSAAGSMGGMFPIGLVMGEVSFDELTAITGIALPYPNYPPTSPLNLAIGGTTLYALDSERRELVWNRLANPMAVNHMPYNGGATGGGVSYLCARPEFQAQVNVPLARTYSWDNGALERVETFAGRGVPDVSVDGDVFTGFEIYFEGELGAAGGTGVSVPLWGALVLLLNEQVGERLGWLNPRLYELQIERGADVFDVIAGGNNGAFEATVGEPWNPCCGLGVPKGKKLAAALREMVGTAAATAAATVAATKG